VVVPSVTNELEASNVSEPTPKVNKRSPPSMLATTLAGLTTIVVVVVPKMRGSVLYEALNSNK
jgi:hypothetical protein